MSRSTGIKRDLRLSKFETYSNYYYINFRSFLGNHGDSYDRFLIRMNEMSESLNICSQVLKKIKYNDCYKQNNKKLTKKNFFNKHELSDYINKNKSGYSSMEELIKHFKS
jgi:NADH-quinone oxidoreductase subunit D